MKRKNKEKKKDNVNKRTEENLFDIGSNLDATAFFNSDNNLKSRLETATKQLYSLLKKELPKNSGPLNELVTKDLTVEQIWEEINLANNPVLKLLKRNVRRNLKSFDQIDFPTVLSKEEEEKMMSENNSLKDEEGLGEFDEFDDEFDMEGDFDGEGDDLLDDVKKKKKKKNLRKKSKKN